MKGCFDLISQASAMDSNTLITGETGTGKELFARAIHANSHRAGKGFIVVDCASLKESLAESILFGYEKGAYTGADRSREGLVRQANGGTLFLDEVGELPLSMQKTFLRVLQEHRFRPLGASKIVESDFRLIAATNRNPDEMVRDETFRSDLLFRLRSTSIEVPPLREHTEDIGEIVIYHVSRICRRSGIELKGVTPEFIEALCAYDWPGNIREVVNSLEKAIASALGEPILFRKHLPRSILIKLARDRVTGAYPPPTAQSSSPRSFPELNALRECTYARVEGQYLRDLMTFTRGDVRKAMEISGLGRSRFYGLIRKHNIPVH
jgi:two-component system NtrC family response regulator